MERELKKFVMVLNTVTPLTSFNSLLECIQPIIKSWGRINQTAVASKPLDVNELEFIPISGAEMERLRRQLRRRTVDIAVARDNSTGKYAVLFKTFSVEKLHAALIESLQDYSNWHNSNHSPGTLAETIKYASQISEGRL